MGSGSVNLRSVKALIGHLRRDRGDAKFGTVADKQHRRELSLSRSQTTKMAAVTKATMPSLKYSQGKLISSYVLKLSHLWE